MNIKTTVKKTIDNLVYSTLGVGSLIFLSNQINAQNTSNTKQQQILEAYVNLTNANTTTANLTNYNSLNSNLIQTLENFLGNENGLYNGSLSGIQTYPKSGRGSIRNLNEEFWLATVQVGHGFGEFTAETPRDHSFTYALYANKLGYGTSAGIAVGRTDDKLKNIILVNNNISPNMIDIKKDIKGNIVDVIYLGTDSRVDVSPKHNMLTNPGYANHILMVPNDKRQGGSIHLFPLEDCLEIAGIYGSGKRSTPDIPAPLNNPKKPKNIILQDPENEYRKKPQQRPDNKKKQNLENYRMGMAFAKTNKQNVGVALFAQLGTSSWDLEVAYFGKARNQEKITPFENIIGDTLQHSNLNYKGISQLIESGDVTLLNHNLSLSLIKHIGPVFFMKAGVATDFLLEKYVGSETHKTWVETPDGDKLDYDNWSIPVSSKTSSIVANPILGLGVDLGRLRVGMDYVFPLTNHATSKYIPQENNSQVRFSAGLDFGSRKENRRDRNGYYGRGNR
ncbi:MAG: hypothetical protein WC758_05640 [Candidatus Woesearchaeota archaeon]